MALELYMVGLVTKDLDRSLEFYRRLGLGLPERSERQRHVNVKMESGITFFLNASGQMPATGLILEFYLASRASVDEKYNELIAFGYKSARPPAFEPSIPVYFAMISDPDEHTIMISAD